MLRCFVVQQMLSRGGGGWWEIWMLPILISRETSTRPSVHRFSMNMQIWTHGTCRVHLFYLNWLQIVYSTFLCFFYYPDVHLWFIFTLSVLDLKLKHDVWICDFTNFVRCMANKHYFLFYRPTSLQTPQMKTFHLKVCIVFIFASVFPVINCFTAGWIFHSSVFVGFNIIVTGCPPEHSHQALSCKMAAEYAQFMSSDKK